VSIYSQKFPRIFQYLYLFPGHFWDFLIFWRIWKIWKFFYFPPGLHPSVPSLSPAPPVSASRLRRCRARDRFCLPCHRCTAAAPRDSRASTPRQGLHPCRRLPSHATPLLPPPLPLLCCAIADAASPASLPERERVRTAP
jgi:hypothetical protein